MNVKLPILSFCLWLAAAMVSAQPPGPYITARSYSGQFMARELRGRQFWSPSPEAERVPMAGGLGFLVTEPAALTADSDKLTLEPALLVVSCERIKELFLLELGLRDEWKGSVELLINSSLTDEQQMSLTAVHRLEGWSYQLELPKTVHPQTLVRALVEVLLTELANRTAGSHSAEAPYWLVEGMSAHLQAYNVPTFIVRPNLQSAGYNRVGIEGLNAVRDGLRGQTPLTFQQLSWPESSDATGTGQALYGSCAELFFESLLRFNDGQTCLRRLMDELPRHMNWQTAFLLAFHSHFAQLLDVEKWWGLTCVNFAEAEATKAWTVQDYWHKLQDALDVPVDVRFAPSLMPARACVTLQEVIMQWSDADALAAFQRAARELEGLQWTTFRADLNLDASVASQNTQRGERTAGELRLRISQQASPLVNRYLTVLLDYMKERPANEEERTPANFHVHPGKREFVRELNELDQERENLRAKFASASNSSQTKFGPLASEGAASTGGAATP
jgi:hypothetical protein